MVRNILPDPAPLLASPSASEMSASFAISAGALEEAITERDKSVVIDAGGVLGLAKQLKTDVKHGLSDAELAGAALEAR